MEKCIFEIVLERFVEGENAAVWQSIDCMNQAPFYRIGKRF